MGTSPPGPAVDKATESSPNSEPVFIQSSAVGDQATNKDYLGFKVYVDALANFLLVPATCAPFTISIEGVWGSGKSSFMLQLKERIKLQSANAVTIDFNAWKYDKQEELWAAFALTVSRSLRANTPLRRRTIGDVLLYFSRLKSPWEVVKIIPKMVLWLALILAFAYGVNWSTHASYRDRLAILQRAADEAAPQKTETTAPSAQAVPPKPAPQGNGSDAAVTSPARDLLLILIANSPWATGFILFLWASWKVQGISGKTPLEIKLEQYIDKPDYKGKAAFVDTFSEDFGKTVNAYAPKDGAKIFIFIDDLDRCEAPKAADLMQAINMMIGESSPLFFIIGLDRAKVAASIAFKYKEIAPYLVSQPDFEGGRGLKDGPDPTRIRALGDEFLEKFIQISFQIPIPDDDQNAKDFINSLIVPVERVRELNWLRRIALRASPNRQTATTDVSPASAGEYDRDPFRIESGPESERIRSIVLSVREILGYNPRRIKAFLNRFRLALYIASSQGLLDKDPKTGKSEVTPEQLGKFIALTSAYPDALSESLTNKSFFNDLEFYLTWESSKRVEQLAIKDYVQSWLRRPGVRALLSPPKTLTASWKNRSSLEGFPVEKIIRILPPIPAPPKKSAESKQESNPANNAGPTDRPLADGISFAHTATIPGDASDSFGLAPHDSSPGDSPLSSGAAPHSQTADPQNIQSFASIRQDAVPTDGPFPVSTSFAPTAPGSGEPRTAGAGIQFSEPLPQDERQADKRQEAAADEHNPPRENDQLSEHDGIASSSKSSRVTGGVIKQIK